jgi:predicted ABC-type ATPase
MTPEQERQFWGQFERDRDSDTGEAAKAHLAAGRPIYYGDPAYPGADDIAQELDPINPTRVSIRVWAGRETIRRQEALLTRGMDFAMETTLAGNRELALLRRARAAGYKVTLVYIGVDSPDVLLGRIAQRITEGGHDVPTADVDHRYIRSLANLAVVLQSLVATAAECE